MPYAQTSVGVGGRVVYTDVVSNIGEAYNAANGIFTAPFNGTYSFAMTTMPSDNGEHFTQLVVNGDVQCTAYSEINKISGESLTSCMAYILHTGFMEK